MTSTFDKFIKQYHSIGSQKADGYDHTDFAGMTQKEKEDAFNLLVEEFTAPGVIEWLIYLDKVKAKDYLEKYVVKPNQDRDGLHRVFFNLYRQTNDSTYKNMLLDNYHHYPEQDRDSVLFMMNSLGLSLSEKTAFLKDVILEEQLKEPLTTAADFYMRCKNIPFSSDEEKKEFYRLRDLLVITDVDTRKATIEDLDDRFWVQQRLRIK